MELGGGDPHVSIAVEHLEQLHARSAPISLDQVVVSAIHFVGVLAIFTVNTRVISGGKPGFCELRVSSRNHFAATGCSTVNTFSCETDGGVPGQ